MRDGFDIAGIWVGGGTPLFLVAGPCVLESAELARRVCGEVRETSGRLGIGYIFKSSYDKANRTSAENYRGPGLHEGLQILARVKRETALPVLTDVHREQDVEAVAQVVDCLQIPAFLSRQTDMVQAVARTGKPINIKKGQFLAPEDMKPISAKAAAEGNNSIILTERGASFGYRNLVVDSVSVAGSALTPIVADLVSMVRIEQIDGQLNDEGVEEISVAVMPTAEWDGTLPTGWRDPGAGED